MEEKMAHNGAINKEVGAGTGQALAGIQIQGEKDETNPKDEQEA